MDYTKAEADFLEFITRLTDAIIEGRVAEYETSFSVPYVTYLNSTFQRHDSFAQVEELLNNLGARANAMVHQSLRPDLRQFILSNDQTFRAHVVWEFDNAYGKTDRLFEMTYFGKLADGQFRLLMSEAGRTLVSLDRWEQVLRRTLDQPGPDKPRPPSGAAVQKLRGNGTGEKS